MKPICTIKCSCGRPMVPYAENLKGTEWLEKCENCNKHRLRTRRKVKKVSRKAARKIKETWRLDCGLPAEETTCEGGALSAKSM